jgi:hypothetical protein
MVLQYVLGFRRLGHEVLLLEKIGRGDLTPAGASLAESDNARFFEDVNGEFAVAPAALVLAENGETAGLSRDAIRDWARDADLLIDIAGGLSGLTELDAIAKRIYLDVDPGFTQLWQAVERIDMRFGGYTDFATVGVGWNRDDRRVPDCGLDWIPTPPPVVLAEWPWSREPEDGELTTVASWRGYGTIVAGGRLFGQKAHSLRRIIDLPKRTGERFALALAIDEGESADLQALRDNGWRLLDPRDVASTPDDYRRFVQRSRGELGVAKLGYVEGRCGWFSDRSVCYLASGRPVIAEDTGFRDTLPVGAGLFAFENVGELEAALDALGADYERQRHAARAVAEEVFDSDRVLEELLERTGARA